MRGSEIQVLQALEEERTISELAEHLDLSRSYVSELVTNLEEQQLVYTRKEGRNKLVKTAGRQFVERLQRLNREFPHIDFSELLTRKTFAVLYHLDQERTVAEIAGLTGDYRNTVNRVLNKLTKRGITGKDGTEYRLNDQFRELRGLAQEYATHRHRLDTPASSFSILWEDFDRFLVGTDEEIDDDRFTETGPGRFQEFGIPLIDTAANHYLHAETDYTLTVPELISHTLLVDSGTRHRTYALLLLEKHDHDKDSVLGVAERYGIRDRIEQLYNFLETQGERRPDDLPEWEQFASTAADYGVKV